MDTASVVAAPPSSRDWDRFVKDLVAWVERNEDVRAAALMGSRARRDRPADRWSDLDLLLFVPKPADFVEDTDWLESLRPVWVTLDHDAPIPGIRVRQVVFEGGLDVDFIPLEAGSFDVLVENPDLRDELAKGFLPLVDKDGEFAGSPLPAPPATMPLALEEHDYGWAVDDFLFQVVWTTKHLRRGELWLAKDDVDGYMKGTLLRMIEWHASATDLAMATWAGADSGGRLLEKWAADWIVADLADTFARYDRADIARALLETMKLFRKVATEVAVVKGFHYPDDRHDAIEAWARMHVEEDQVEYQREPLQAVH